MVNERRAMMALQHPFLVRLYSTFQDRHSIYLVLEVSLGGELFSVLRSRTLFDENTAKFYAAGVVVAFEYMHERGYIYRSNPTLSTQPQLPPLSLSP
jgi:serine/threonine protein kinase